MRHPIRLLATLAALFGTGPASALDWDRRYPRDVDFVLTRQGQVLVAHTERPIVRLRDAQEVLLELCVPRRRDLRRYEFATIAILNRAATQGITVVDAAALCDLLDGRDAVGRPLVIDNDITGIADEIFLRLEDGLPEGLALPPERPVYGDG